MQVVVNRVFSDIGSLRRIMADANNEVEFSQLLATSPGLKH